MAIVARAEVGNPASGPSPSPVHVEPRPAARVPMAAAAGRTTATASAQVLPLSTSGTWIDRHWIAILGFGLLPLAIFISVYRLLETQPGFHLDESAIAYNAWKLVQTGTDENGTPWPLVFRSYGYYQGSTLTYLIAGVFSLTGPGILAARLVTASAALLAAILLGWLGARVTGRPAVGLITTAGALLTPWLYETGRLVIEPVLMPLVLVTSLLILQAQRPDRRWSWTTVAGLALSLAMLAYTYTVGRVLAPMLAVGLLFYFRRPTWTNVPRVWLLLLIVLGPLIAYGLANPDVLAGRLQQTSAIRGLSLSDAAMTFAQHVLANIDPRALLLTGDRIPRHHVQGVMGSMLAVTVVLAAIGIGRIVWRHRGDPWWRFVVYGLLVSLIPASLTIDISNALRLITVPVFLTVLTLPALAWLSEWPAEGRWRRPILALVGAALVAQGAWFQVRFHEIAPYRGGWFDQEFPVLFDKALATGADPIYLVDGIVPPYLHAYWYGALRGVPESRFVHLTGAARPPAGATVISGETDCGACQVIATHGFFRLYVAS
jgi:4-amino-4-deoxy-L-arabinose transferase-like glycosyltransferase